MQNFLQIVNFSVKEIKIFLPGMKVRIHPVAVLFFKGQGFKTGQCMLQESLRRSNSAFCGYGSGFSGWLPWRCP